MKDVEYYKALFRGARSSKDVRKIELALAELNLAPARWVPRAVLHHLARAMDLLTAKGAKLENSHYASRVTFKDLPEDWQ